MLNHMYCLNNNPLKSFRCEVDWKDPNLEPKLFIFSSLVVDDKRGKEREPGFDVEKMQEYLS